MKYVGTLGSSYSGKLGGVVASRNTYGTYFRRLVSPVNVKSPGQQIQRNAFGAASQAWRTLTSTLQAAWVTAAPSLPVISKSGSTVILTGQALFMYCNVLLVKAGLPVIVTPPTSTTAPGFTVPTISVNGSGYVAITFNADPWNVVGGAVDMSISAAITAGRNYVGTYYALGCVSNPETTEVDLTSGTAYPAGTNLQLSFVAETPDGRKTSPQIVPVVTTNAHLVSAVHGAAGVGVLHMSSTISVVAGQAIGYDSTAAITLHALNTISSTSITIAEATSVGNSITEDGSVPGVNATVTPIVMT